MPLLAAPALLLTPEDCARLWPYLREGLARGRAAGRSVPEAVLDTAADMERLALSAADRLQGRPAPGTDTRTAGSLPGGASLPQPDMVLTVAAAAGAAGVSERHMRRLCQGGAVYAVRAVPGSAWAVSAASLAGWVASRRREEHERKAA